MINIIAGTGGASASNEPSNVSSTVKKPESEARSSVARTDPGAAVVTLSAQASAQSPGQGQAELAAAAPAPRETGGELEPERASSATPAAATPASPAAAPAVSTAVAAGVAAATDAATGAEGAAAQVLLSKSIPKTFELADINQDEQISAKERGDFEARQAAQLASRASPAADAAVKAYQQIDQFSRSN